MSQTWQTRYCRRIGLAQNQPGRLLHVDGWSVVTTGWALLAYSEVGGQRLSLREVNDQTSKQQRALRPLLLEKPLNPQRVGLVDLACWCESVSWDMCRHCAGRGCEDCDFAPRSLPGGVPRPGLLAGVCIDRNLLAYLLAPELFTPDHEFIDVGRWREAGVIVEGKRFRIVLVRYPDPLGPASTSISPQFHPDPLYLSLWCGREDPTTRLVLADWLEDHHDPYAQTVRQEATARRPRRTGPQQPGSCLSKAR